MNDNIQTLVLSNRGGGRLEYYYDTFPTKKEKLLMWELLCGAVKNFYENNEKILND